MRDGATRALGALAVSLVTLGLLLGWAGPGVLEVLAPGRWLGWPVAGYVLAQLAGALLRAQRYRVLLGADGHSRVPPFGFLLWVTLARNMLVDLVPARAGELAYVVFLNRGYRVALPACLSSLGLSLVFDVLALVLLAAALWLASLDPGALPVRGWLAAVLLWGLAWLAYAGAAAPSRWFAGLAERTRSPWLGRLWRLAADSFASLARVHAAGVFWPVLALSLGLRAVKYGGLYLLFLAVTWQDWPAFAAAAPWQVLIALVSAEAAASLPVPAFMSFGTYEAGGLGAWVALGFPPDTAVGIMFSVHLLSQLVDYTLGAAGLGLVVWSARRRDR